MRLRWAIRGLIFLPEWLQKSDRRYSEVYLIYCCFREGGVPAAQLVSTPWAALVEHDAVS